MNVLARLTALGALAAAAALAQWGGTLRFAIRSEPRTLNPLQASDESSHVIAYLTSGTLVRVNRVTQKTEPALATSWKWSEGGTRVQFQLRKGVRFSDGTAFDAADVAHTIAAALDPALLSPFTFGLRVGGADPKVQVIAPDAVAVRFAAPPSGWELIFDELPVRSSRSAQADRAVLGPFLVREHRSGSGFVLARNPHYWKTAAGGRALPYADAVVIDVVSNAETELLRFRRGELDFINKVGPDQFQRLAGENRGAARNLGPSLEAEQMWFNLAGQAPLAAHKKAWFQSREFRKAVSLAIRRDDIARVAFQGLATPAGGPVSPANKRWANESIGPVRHDAASARKLLAQAGFRLEGNRLRDRTGQAVEFSLITNAGNPTRARTATMMQQDLAAVGIDVRVVPLDFPALIERLTRTRQYDACLLSMANADPDPNGWANYYLSSGPNHPWNPAQAAPSTPWEAEIDKLMRLQASTQDAARRKKSYDRIQEILRDQEPVLYLVYKSVLSAVGERLGNAQPAPLFPHVFWNIDQLVAGPGRQISQAR